MTEVLVNQQLMELTIQALGMFKVMLAHTHTHRNTQTHNSLGDGPTAPEPWDPLMDRVSGASPVAGGRAGGTTSEVSVRFSPRVLSTTVMSSWLRINF